MKKLYLHAPCFLGDEIVFTGAVRDLKKAAPDLELHIVTRNRELWVGNPHITRIHNGRGQLADVQAPILGGHCPRWRDFVETPIHYLEAYLQSLARSLRIEAKVTTFKGDVYPDACWSRFDLPKRFWIVVAGCNPLVPVKGWSTENYQQVIDNFRGRMDFIQVGSHREWFPPLKGAMDLVGKTGIRDLVNIVYKAEGVLCPITSLMHLSAATAVDVRRTNFVLRPCVVIAGARESTHFISYPGHRILSNIGTLQCCRKRACGHSKFSEGPSNRGCGYPVVRGGSVIPKCMAMITPEDVSKAIEGYYAGDLMMLPER